MMSAGLYARPSSDPALWVSITIQYHKPGTVVAECRDTEIGRKYAADTNSSAAGAAQTWAGGYLNSFQAWSYARNAFDKWSLLVAQRIAALRAAPPQDAKK